MKTRQDFVLSLSIPETKVMAAGREACPKDSSPTHTEHGDIEYVRDFTYLGSTIEASGKWMSIAELRSIQNIWSFT